MIHGDTQEKDEISVGGNPFGGEAAFGVSGNDLQATATALEAHGAIQQTPDELAHAQERMANHAAAAYSQVIAVGGTVDDARRAAEDAAGAVGHGQNTAVIANAAEIGQTRAQGPMDSMNAIDEQERGNSVLAEMTVGAAAFGAAGLGLAANRPDFLSPSGERLGAHESQQARYTGGEMMMCGVLAAGHCSAENLPSGPELSVPDRSQSQVHGIS